jgi:hypothetical protein
MYYYSTLISSLWVNFMCVLDSIYFFFFFFLNVISSS